MKTESTPIIVIDINGGAIHDVNASIPVRVIILDEDTEGGDPSNVRQINGNEVYVHDYVVTEQASSKDYATFIASEVDLRVPLTQEQYIETGGTRCPFCGSTDYEAERVDVCNGAASQEISCNACGKVWVDTYKLTGFEVVE